MAEPACKAGGAFAAQSGAFAETFLGFRAV